MTPFNDDQSIDYGALSALVEEQVESGSHGISVTGTTGEPGSLVLAERLEMIEASASAVAGRVPFVPGTGTHQLPETIELTKKAAEVDADAALVIVPYYSRPTQAGLYEWYSRIAESVDISILLYNIPSRTGVEISPETVGRLYRDHPNIIGMKEASPNFSHANFVMQECGEDFLLFSGLEALCFPILAIGGAGFISVTANLVPREIAELYDVFEAGDWRTARALHYKLLELNDVVLTETNPTAVKWLLGRMGKINPTVRPPLIPLSESGQTTVATAAQTWNLLDGREAWA
ncbi:4-hydroxy-tetrahydrodipicolinate synthase [Brevibacterium sp. K11IcPPYGO002]|uniref:4-hydroxy-tetrahydrodipicolinate synthase n=1 Tax=Brevibacterium sp. K11IcPPYGO002 TaxID=3058837 RepID=UPI003D815EA0